MINETVAHYKILRKLGAGGMGVVYEAEDTKLGRRVALKFLPEESRRDSQALERFLREARAASALNHSAICTIHAIEDSDDRTFISMELLEGQSLDKLLMSGPLPVGRVIEIGIQLADALDAAHKKGIVHRDIKPANIFVTDSGAVKVLDFGLAKLLPRASDESGANTIDAHAATLLTSPGMAVGTIQYMSPEQARGEEIDARSDLFSLGAVLYQMLTGKQAFPGSTSAVVFDNILRNDPVPPVEFNADTPPELERILSKALEKDRDVRYQVAAELRADLKRLQRQIDSGSRLASQKSARVAAVEAPVPTASQTPAPGSETKTPSSGSVIVAAARHHKIGTALAILGILAVAAAAGYGVYSIFLRTRHVPFENFSIENLTNNGHVSHAAISPDGKYLLLVRDENGLESLWLRHIPTASNTQILPPTATDYIGLTFSPDGNYIFCVRRDEEEHTLASLYSATVLGGAPRLILKDVDSPITFSPDGQRFAYLRQDHDSPSFDLLLAHSYGTPDHALFREQLLPGGNAYSPAWSPDGKVIVIPVPQADQGFNTALLTVDVDSGKQHLEASPATRIYRLPAWMPDGKSLIVSDFSAMAALNVQLGILSYPDGQYRRLTSDTNAYLFPSVAADGRTIVASQLQLKYNIQIADLTKPDDVHTLQLSSRGAMWRWDWTADGRIVLPQYPDIRVVNPAGGETVIYSDAAHFADQVTSCDEGRYFVYRAPSRASKASFNLWRMSTSGADAKQLTFGSADTDPFCSSDGKWLYYLDETDNQALKRVSLDGGTPETVLRPANGIVALSPDGKTLAGYEVRELDHKLMLKLYSIDDKRFTYHDIDQAAIWPLLFAPDGKAVIYSVRQKGTVNLWLQPLDNSPARQLTHFISENINAVRISKDGTKLAVERGHEESDAVILRDAPH